MKLKDNSHLYGDAKATAKSVAAGARVKEIEEASIAFEAENDNPAAIKRLAIALTAASRIDEAEKLYSKYVSVAPADQDAFYEYALLNKLLGNKIKAIELFTKVIEMAPSSPLARSAEYEMWALDGRGLDSWVRKKA